MLILLSASSVQIGAGAAAGLLRSYGVPLVVALRLGFGALLLVIVRPPDLNRLVGGAGAWRSPVLLGIVFAAMNTSFYVAISRIPLGIAVTLEFVGPLAAALLGSRRWRDLAWVVCAGAGVWILARGRTEGADVIGVAAAFLAGVGWFAFIHVGGRVAREWPDGRGLTVAMVVATVLVLPGALVLGEPARLLAAPEIVLAGLLIAVFSSVLPMTLELAALGRLRPETYGILISLEPAVAALAGFVLLGQPLGIEEVLAIGLVIVAGVGATLTARNVPVVPGEMEAS